MKQKTSSGKSVYQVWMMEENETVMNTAFAHGERICIDQAVKAIQSASPTLRQVSRQNTTMICTLNNPAF